MTPEEAAAPLQSGVDAPPPPQRPAPERKPLARKAPQQLPED